MKQSIFIKTNYLTNDCYGIGKLIYKLVINILDKEMFIKLEELI